MNKWGEMASKSLNQFGKNKVMYTLCTVLYERFGPVQLWCTILPGIVELWVLLVLTTQLRCTLVYRHYTNVDVWKCNELCKEPSDRFSFLGLIVTMEQTWFHLLSRQQPTGHEVHCSLLLSYSCHHGDIRLIAVLAIVGHKFVANNKFSCLLWLLSTDEDY
jgi:hypothetical protein